MAAYRRVYDSRHLQADCQEPGSAPEPTLGSRVWATFTFIFTKCGINSIKQHSRKLLQFEISKMLIAV